MAEHKGETCLIYSMWTGYMEIPTIKNFINIVGGNTYIVHSSGHIVLHDLNRMLNMINPRHILFIHTENKPDSICIDLKERIVQLMDGEEMRL